VAIASGSCPSCGAPIEFTVGASLSKVCEYCHSTVYRTDRGLEDLGKVAAIANVPSLVAVGDEGTLGGRPLLVLGRVQLDHGAGPWDEYYVAFDHGASWGWLAYAEGTYYATSLAGSDVRVPPFESLALEADVSLGRLGTFRVAELKTGRVVSAEGELPARLPPGLVRRYADLFGQGEAFATLDYGDGTAPPEVYVGRRFEESELSLTKLSPRTAEAVKVEAIVCPSCGGSVPKRGGERTERLGCPFCGAVSDIAAQRIISVQELERGKPPIPLGARGTLGGKSWVCIAHLKRSAEIEGERFRWDELLLFSEGTGFRWLVRDEAAWLLVTAVNVAELDLRDMPRSVGYQGRRHTLRNQNPARVDYVLGEVFWKCEVGETVRASDFVAGDAVLSREESPGEVRWSHSIPISWKDLAGAFGLPVGRPARVDRDAVSAPSMMGGANAVVLLLVILVVLIVIVEALDDDGGGSGGGAVFGGSGTYYGGK
jgi:hypothetical protein